MFVISKNELMTILKISTIPDILLPECFAKNMISMWSLYERTNEVLWWKDFKEKTIMVITFRNLMTHGFENSLLTLISVEPSQNTIVYFEMVLSHGMRSSNGIKDRVRIPDIFQFDPGGHCDGFSGFSLEQVSVEWNLTGVQSSVLVTCEVFGRFWLLEDFTSFAELAIVVISWFVLDNTDYSVLFDTTPSCLKVQVTNKTF